MVTRLNVIKDELVRDDLEDLREAIGYSVRYVSVDQDEAKITKKKEAGADLPASTTMTASSIRVRCDRHPAWQ